MARKKGGNLIEQQQYPNQHQYQQQYPNQYQQQYQQITLE